MAAMKSILTATLLLSLTGTAMGQNALGDGRVLDANLSRTQGPVNPRVNNFAEQLRFNNAIVTGQAGGGKSFRSSIGYGAVDAFRSTTSEDSLYNFRRDSTSSVYTGVGIRASDALRYQFALTTNQSVPSFLSQTSIARPAGQVATGATVSAMRSTADFATAQTFRPTLVGTRQDEWGAEYVAKASPLLGVSWVKVAESPLYASNVTGTTTAQQAAAQAGDPSAPKTYTEPQPGAQPGAKALSPGATPLVPGLTGMETASRSVTPTLDRDTTGAAKRVDPLSTRVESSMRSELLNRFKLSATPDEPPAAQAQKPIEPVTLDQQMDTLRRMLRGEAPAKVDDKPKTNPDGTRIIPPLPADKPDATTPPAPAPGETKPDEQPPIYKPVKPGETVTPQMLRGMRQMADTRLETLVRIGTQGAGENKDPNNYTQFMQAGQDLLAKGKFFDAEERFTRALSAMSGDPMARVGRMHAQLGAGLYLSAAANLRNLISDHPEMVATRYAQNLLPTPERNDKIVAQLKDEMSRTQSAMTREAALLVAYLGYQKESPETVNFGLDEFARRTDPSEAGNPDRVLLDLLRRTWVAK